MPAETKTNPTIHTDALIALHDVSFGYDKQAMVLHGVTGVIQPGRVCAIIGPNAAGKSTLLKLLLGQAEPQRGSILIDGQAVTGLTPRHRAAMISYVPQRPAAHLTFRVEEIVAMGRFARPDNADAIDDAITTFDLASIRHRVYGELSIGQQQRVALARAAAQAADATPDRHAILLDEPISAMDLKHVHATMRQLRVFAQQGFGIVMVLHDLNLAATYADDVWILDDGRLLKAGPWKEVLQRSVLEPVYGVEIRESFSQELGRPVFHVVEPATMPSTLADS